VDIKPDCFFRNYLTYRLSLYSWQTNGWPYGIEKLCKFLLAALLSPINKKKLRQRVLDRGVIESQRDETAIVVQRVSKTKRTGLQFRPIRAECIRRHAENENPRVFQPILDLHRNAVAGLEHPLVEPHPQPIRPQPLCNFADDILIFGTVAQVHVKGVLLAQVGQGVPPGINKSGQQTAYSL